MLLGSALLAAMLGCCAALGAVSLTHEEGALVVDVKSMPPASTLWLVRLHPHAAGCEDTEAVEDMANVPIEGESMKTSFPDDELDPGKYCVLVMSPSGNFTSPQPVEVKGQPGEMIRAPPSDHACTTWNATVIPQGSYEQRTIKVSVYVFKDKAPQCQRLRVGLWKAISPAALEQSTPCVDGIWSAGEETKTLANLSVVVLFEDLKPGNYCVRVTPVCSPPEDCVALTSKVIELPSGLGGDARLEMAGATFQSRMLWLLLLPLLAGAAVVIALAVFCVRRQSWLARHKPFILSSPLPMFHKPRVDPGPPVVKVVYSRDSESHVAAVSRLCELLQRELGFRVEWDEVAMDLAHITHDWAMAMAQLPCPQFNPAAGTNTTVKMLVLESDGALLKHKAYRQHKDLGQVSESNVDELYHTTYAALLSNHAQALGDYCHILVARLPYTTLPDRLDLVPEKRYLLPHHLQPLLQALLHGTTLPKSRADLALHSAGYSRFSTALAEAGSFHAEKGFAGDSVCGKLRAILAES